MAGRPTPEQERLLVDAKLGIEIERFLESKVGIYLKKRAREEWEEALSEFRDADPFNGELVQKIQHRMWRADTFAKWLADAALTGQIAEEQLREPAHTNEEC